MSQCDHPPFNKPIRQLCYEQRERKRRAGHRRILKYRGRAHWPIKIPAIRNPESTKKRSTPLHAKPSDCFTHAVADPGTGRNWFWP